MFCSGHIYGLPYVTEHALRSLRIVSPQETCIPTVKHERVTLTTDFRANLRPNIFALLDKALRSRSVSTLSPSLGVTMCPRYLKWVTLSRWTLLGCTGGTFCGHLAPCWLRRSCIIYMLQVRYTLGHVLQQPFVDLQQLFQATDRRTQQSHVVRATKIVDANVINVTADMATAELDDQRIHVYIEHFGRGQTTLPHTAFNPTLNPSITRIRTCT